MENFFECLSLVTTSFHSSLLSITLSSVYKLSKLSITQTLFTQENNNEEYFSHITPATLTLRSRASGRKISAKIKIMIYMNFMIALCENVMNNWLITYHNTTFAWCARVCVCNYVSIHLPNCLSCSWVYVCVYELPTFNDININCNEILPHNILWVEVYSTHAYCLPITEHTLFPFFLYRTHMQMSKWKLCNLLPPFWVHGSAHITHNPTDRLPIYAETFVKIY